MDITIKDSELEKSLQVSVRVSSSNHIRMIKLGKAGTIGSSLIRDFIRIRELKSTNTKGVISSLDGDHIYARSIIPNEVYHLTFTDKDEVITKKLSLENVAQLITELAALINADFVPLIES